ncbi:MAG: tetratricopeptide repeat protein, partial [Myxococcota bacterium]
MRDFEAGMRALRQAGQNPSPEAYARARDRLAAAVAADDRLWEAWHNLGVVHYLVGEDEQAVAAFGKTLDINPSHVASLLARAEVHRGAGRGDRAREDYAAVIARGGEDQADLVRDATARLASLLREERKYKDAVEVVRNTLRTSGASAKVYVELGLVYLAQGRDELAELVLIKAIELDDKEPSAHNGMALLALKRGQSQEAFDRFDFATSLDPNYIDARFNKASVLLDAGDFGRAKAELTAVVDSKPDDFSARVALGLACRGLGEYDQAKSHWERVVSRASPRSQVRGDALFNLAILQMNFVEDYKAANTALDRYLQEAPRNHPKRKMAQEKKKELGL